jgi:release factor glutamine methyltransferase
MNATAGIRDIIVEVRDKLSRANIDEPRITAELLVGFALGCERSDLLAKGRDPLDAPSRARLDAALARRLAHEPIEYITGWREFYSRRFICEPAALIPRPETEGFIDESKKRLPKDFAGAAIDLGTGAGALAVTLALEFPRAKLVATDISPTALLVARKNAQLHKVEKRVALACGDWLTAFAPRKQFGLIVANPPYVDDGYAPIMHPEVRDHEPHVALFGGHGGFDQIKRLLPQVASRLAPGGVYCQEFAAGHADEVEAMAKAAGLKNIEIVRDFAGIERTLVASA